MESVWLEHSPLLFRKEWKEIAKAKSKYHVDISEQGKKNRTYKGVTYDSLTELRFLQEYIEPNGFIWARPYKRIKYCIIIGRNGIIINISFLFYCRCF